MTHGQAQTKPDKNSGNQRTVLLVLGLLALATVFLLPALVSKPWIVDGSLDGPASVDSSPTSVSPSTAAEKTRYRRESQTVLAKIIPVRDLLQDQSVELWAAIEFQLALAKIETGDGQYSYGQYRQSLESYEQALAGFTALEALGQKKLTDALAIGLEAIESLNIGGAQGAGELATAIAADDPQVQELAARIVSLPELAEQLESGDMARIANHLDAAQIAYQAAVNVDPMHKRAAESLASIKTGITEGRFRQHMSRAYAALDRGDYEAAVAAFEQAGTVYPGHAAIAQGLAQVENRSSQLSLDRQLAHAAELELNEEWAQAITVYEELLTQDPTLTAAKARLIPVKARADLDRRLERFNEDPLRLSRRAVYQQAQSALSDAGEISNPGNRLLGQIEELKTFMKRALTSVNVVFQSDNLTEVTLFRVAQLGQFEQTSLSLKPGRYIIAGTRRGFRDVRVEFTVTGEPLDEPIVVSCQEPI